MPPENFRRNIFCVTPDESGQKLLQCLQRRLAKADEASVHRWIRTGQVRVNGGRRKAFDRLVAGDEIRLPPFAALRVAESLERGQESECTSGPVAGLGVEVLAETPELLVLLKPAGLPVHPGTGHTDSVTTRLAACYERAAFMPTPAHRLDRDTSGILLVARTYESLRALSEALAGHCVRKEYLAWCVGTWPHSEPLTLHDTLAKAETIPPHSGKSREQVQRVGMNEGGKEASLTVHLLKRRRDASLLRIELHTGRTHQIRAQLALRGHAVAGDRKYGGKDGVLLGTPLLLHACRITLPGGQCFSALPLWAGPWVVDNLPFAHGTMGYEQVNMVQPV